MATIGNDKLTLRDIAAARRANGSLDPNILDFVTETNGVLDDMTFIRGDEGPTLRSTIRVANPHGTWVQYYEGIPATKTGFMQVTDTCGRIKARIEIDRDMYDHAKDKVGVINNQIKAHVAGIKEDVVDALFYGNIKNEPRKFNGLANYFDRYDSGSLSSRNYAYTVLNGSVATTDSDYSASALRSIFLVGWGENAVTCFHHENSPLAGLSTGKLEDDTAFDASGNPYKVKTQEIAWELGLAVRDFHYAGRICNIESDKFASSTARPDIIMLLRHLRGRVKRDGVRRAWYMPEQVWEHIEDKLAATTNTNAIKYGDMQENKPESLFGIPVHICDALDTNESAVAVFS